MVYGSLLPESTWTLHFKENNATIRKILWENFVHRGLLGENSKCWMSIQRIGDV